MLPSNMMFHLIFTINASQIRFFSVKCIKIITKTSIKSEQFEPNTLKLRHEYWYFIAYTRNVSSNTSTSSCLQLCRVQQWGYQATMPSLNPAVAPQYLQQTESGLFIFIFAVFSFLSFYSTNIINLELIYLYFPPSFHLTVVSVLQAFRC